MVDRKVSVARVFAWHFLRQHRWGFTAIAAYLVVLAAFSFLTGLPAHTTNSEKFAFTVLVPVTSAMMYLLAVFSFGLAGDLAARESMYPARLFTLPVTTHQLVWYPLVYGAASMVALWICTALFGLWPSGMHLPLLWPCLFVVVFLGWAQALTWMPYGLRGLRVLFAALWLITVDTIVLLAIFLHARESTMIAFLAPQLPLMYLTARYAVAAARRGDTPDWSRSVSREQATHARPFTSRKHAQMWLEWRQNGWSLISLVGMVIPFELLLLFAAGTALAFIYIVLGFVLVTPPFLAACTAATMRNSLTPFTATRPLTDARLIAPKLQVALLSTLLTWAVVLVAIPIALVWSDKWTMTLASARSFAAYVGTWRAVMVGLLVIGALAATTWKQLVQSLYINLSARAWVSKLSVFLTLVLLVALIPVGDWVLGSSVIMAALWRNLRWILAALVLLKMTAGAWVVTRLHRTQALAANVLMVAAAVWMMTVLLLHGLLLWLLDTPHFPAYYTALIAILAVPLARLSAAPLALHQSRHQ